MKWLKLLCKSAEADEKPVSAADGHEAANVPESELPLSTLTFDEIYERYATGVLRLVYFYLGDRQHAEDICQDVFVKLLTVNPPLREGREAAWLHKVALNKCRDHWRNSWVRRVFLGSGTFTFESIPAPDELSSRTDSEDLMTAIYQLPPDFKEVTLLYYYQGYSISEIAGILSVPEGTISSRLSRAREKLTAILDEGKDGAKSARKSR